MGLLSHLGRPANSIEYRFVAYNSKEYCIGTIEYNGVNVSFLIDKEDYETVSQYSWHVSANNYISTTVEHVGKRKALYLHNLVMKRDAFLGKGQPESIDHINRIGFDNRKENLRIISQSEQNINQKQKRRVVILPDNCGLSSEDIPRHIWYVKANGGHGDRFAIEFKTEGVIWKTTSSKGVSIQAKLEQAKVKLAELYQQYPYLNPELNNELASILRNSFEEVLLL
jgi:hypothetical protein